MSVKRTYIDAGVLIAAAGGNDEVSDRANEILDDPQREFASSSFVRLEVLPKAVYHKNQAEVEFYDTYMAYVKYWASSIDNIIAEAEKQASTLGLSAMDALHVAAAISVGADELVTTEKPGKPIHRVRHVKVVSIYPGNVGT